MNAQKIINRTKRLCKKCGVTVFICSDKDQDDEGKTAFYDKGEIHIYTKEKSDNWVAVHLLHEFCHYLQEAKYIYCSGYPLSDTFYEHHTYMVELEVEYLTYKWLHKWSADADLLKECKVLIIDNLRNYC